MKPRIMLPLLAMLAGCAPAATPKDWGPQVESANDELLNKGNVGKVREFFAPAYVAHVTGQDLSGGPEVIEGFVKGLRAAFPDLSTEIKVLATEGDRVTWVRTSRGTHRSDYMGVPATGRVVTWQDMIVTRYEAGKIAEEWAVSDLGERLRVP